MAERPQGRPCIPYDIPLGEGDRARLVLPADLTQAEADRICGVIQTLPLAADLERSGEAAALLPGSGHA